MKKKSGVKKIKNLKGFAIQFMPFSEIRDLAGEERIKKILNVAEKDNIIILQGRLKPVEEGKLIEETMSKIGKTNSFKGIEIAVVSEDQQGFLSKIKKNILNTLTGGDLGSVTIIGPATVVKEIKRNPKKIELLLNG